MDYGFTVQPPFPEFDLFPRVRWISPLDYEFRHGDARLRLDCQYLVVQAERLYERAYSWRQPTDLNASRKFVNRFLEWMFQWMEITMKKRGTSYNPPARAEWKGFVERQLTEVELASLDEWKPKPAEIFEGLSLLTTQLYRVTLSYSQERKLASVTLICDNKALQWGGYGLTSADTDVPAALKMAIFKHFHVLQEDWTGLLAQPPKSRRG